MNRPHAIGRGVKPSAFRQPARSTVARKIAPLLYFCGFAGPFSAPLSQASTVHDPIAAGRSAAARAVAIEVAAVGAVAAVFLIQGRWAAAGAAVGGLAMAAGHAVAAAVSFAGGIQPAGMAFARLLLGAMGKWLVTLAIVALALEVWRLPPLPVVVGVTAGVLAYLVGLNLRSNPVAGLKRDR